MAKAEKRKLPRVKARAGSSSDSYAPSGFQFAFVSSPAEGRQQCTGLHSCRESVNSVLKSHVFGNHGKDAPADLTRFRLLIAGPGADAKTRLFGAKACLNLCEGIAGWKRSTISTVKHEKYKNAWLITGPGEWMKSPQLVSAATFILRVCCQNSITAKSYDELEVAWLKLIKRSSSNDVDSFLSLYWDKMYVLLKEADKIFPAADYKELWGEDYGGSFGHQSGIYQFWNNSNQYSPKAAQARKRFKEFVKNELPRKNPLRRK